jgi:hypothetical protein
MLFLIGTSCETTRIDPPPFNVQKPEEPMYVEITGETAVERERQYAFNLIKAYTHIDMLGLYIDDLWKYIEVLKGNF